MDVYWKFKLVTRETTRNMLRVVLGKTEHAEVDVMEIVATMYPYIVDPDTGELHASNLHKVVEMVKTVDLMEVLASPQSMVKAHQKAAAIPIAKAMLKARYVELTPAKPRDLGTYIQYLSDFYDQNKGAK